MPDGFPPENQPDDFKPMFEGGSSKMSLTRRAFLTTAPLAAGGLALYAAFPGRHQYVITHRTIPIRNLPDAFLNYRIVQISDIHLTEYTEPWFLQKMIAEVNTLNPDLLLFTGDLISRGPASDHHAWRAAGVAAEMLQDIHAPRFAILGNHDVSVGADKVIAPLEAHGTPVLVDSYFPLQIKGDVLWLAGLDDPGTRHPDLDMAIPENPRAPVILMCHEPDFADRILHHKRFPLIDLMLSGHSHGGQVRLPFVGPLILPPMGQKYVSGLFHFGHMQLYVNRGIGTVGLPFRLNCPAELTEITLVRA